jgi:hypothetical protein
LFLISRSGCKKREGLIKAVGLLAFLFAFALLFCSSENEIGGSFDYISGNCKSRHIEIKKVKGFGDKYYLIKIFKKKGSPGGREFLGVVNGKRLTVYKGTKLYGDDLKTAGIVIFRGDTITVDSEGKSCIYGRR